MCSTRPSYCRPTRGRPSATSARVRRCGSSWRGRRRSSARERESWPDRGSNIYMYMSCSHTHPDTSVYVLINTHVHKHRQTWHQSLYCGNNAREGVLHHDYGQDGVVRSAPSSALNSSKEPRLGYYCFYTTVPYTYSA